MDIKKRVVIFIDGSNLYHILRNLFRNKRMRDFDFIRFINYLVEDDELIRTYYYTAPLDKKKDEGTYIKQQKFFEKLKRISNFKLILCRMQKQRINHKIIYLVKEDDIHLAVDMVKLAYNNVYDKAILISSDGDFVPAIKTIQEIGKKIKNIGFKNKFSYYLKQECDEFIKLNKKDIKDFFK